MLCEGLNGGERSSKFFSYIRHLHLIHSLSVVCSFVNRMKDEDILLLRAIGIVEDLLSNIEMRKRKINKNFKVEFGQIRLSSKQENEANENQQQENIDGESNDKKWKPCDDRVILLVLFRLILRLVAIDCHISAFQYAKLQLSLDFDSGDTLCCGLIADTLAFRCNDPEFVIERDRRVKEREIVILRNQFGEQERQDQKKDSKLAEKSNNIDINLEIDEYFEMLQSQKHVNQKEKEKSEDNSALKQETDQQQIEQQRNDKRNRIKIQQQKGYINVHDLEDAPNDVRLHEGPLCYSVAFAYYLIEKQRIEEEMKQSLEKKLKKNKKRKDNQNQKNKQDEQYRDEQEQIDMNTKLSSDVDQSIYETDKLCVRALLLHPHILSLLVNKMNQPINNNSNREQIIDENREVNRQKIIIGFRQLIGDNTNQERNNNSISQFGKIWKKESGSASLAHLSEIYTARNVKIFEEQGFIWRLVCVAGAISQISSYQPIIRSSQSSSSSSQFIIDLPNIISSSPYLIYLSQNPHLVSKLKSNLQIRSSLFFPDSNMNDFQHLNINDYNIDNWVEEAKWKIQLKEKMKSKKGNKQNETSYILIPPQRQPSLFAFLEDSQYEGYLMNNQNGSSNDVLVGEERMIWGQQIRQMMILGAEIGGRGRMGNRFGGGIMVGNRRGRRGFMGLGREMQNNQIRNRQLGEGDINNFDLNDEGVNAAEVGVLDRFQNIDMQRLNNSSPSFLQRLQRRINFSYHPIAIFFISILPWYHL
ncbi:MAG: hypothetical protein EZS28_018650 [Streblomastix strix]|uniref:Uncharacterized protein n=1 Tax=Streblomastix strix TaxID=222440 RepID=A0A5J4VU33_9EUKA|nr:MAG: hypothetical protein EZS28_018650 [Streblomastix strix]